jgi:hypothetical protein
MDSFTSKFLDNMDRDGFVRILSRFGNIYDNGQEHGFIDWFRQWFRDKGTLSLWMIITEKMAQTMPMDSKLTDIFWTHAVHTTIHIQNRVMLRNNNDKNPYEPWKGSTDNNLYIKVTQGSILLIEIYVDDIVFGGTNDRLSQKFAKDMHNEFEMSLLGEISFFLGLQICQSNQEIFISQTKYIREMLKSFGMEYWKLVTTPMQTRCKLSKDDG